MVFWIGNQTQTIKAKINKWDNIKLKSFSQQKIIKSMKKQPMEREKIFTDHISDRAKELRYM